MAKPRQGGLGRGLGSLIPSEPAQPVDSSPLRDIAVGDIVPNTYQPRQAFDEEALAALTASVRELGVLQPVLVRKHGESQFELIAGERRWRAATRAGLDRIPAIVRDVDNETSLAQAIEEASAFQQLVNEFSLTQEEVASRVGRSRPAIANALRLLQLPVDVQRLIVEGRLSAGHGRVLVSVEADHRDELIQQVLAEGLSVRALESAARGESAASDAGENDTLGSSDSMTADPATTSTGPAAAPDDAVVGITKPPALLELEELLGERFDTKVGINLGTKRGRLTIDFADIDDLERIYALMTGE
jgi:ParB family chromosome partitioning protein